MILTRTVRFQLIALTVASVLAAAVLGVVFLRVPEAAGVGRYTVTASFSHGASLYEGAEVNYLGSPVGKVAEMKVAEEGILVAMSLRDSVEVPGNVSAAIHSRSAVGEQYIDLVPADGTPDVPALGPDDNIPAERTTTPVEIGALLDNVNEFAESLPVEDLNALLRESSLALDGRQEDLAGLIDDGGQLIATANDHVDQTRRLIEDFEPLAGAVNARTGEIERFTASLARVTATLKAGDGDIRALLDDTPDLADETTTFLKQVDPPLRQLLADADTVTELFATYSGGLGNILSIYPKVVAMVQSITAPFAEDGQIALDMANLNDPPACLDGFVPPKKWRDPANQKPQKLGRLYCDIPKNDPRVVKGARNLPCIRYPGLRGATPDICRSLAGY